MKSNYLLPDEYALLVEKKQDLHRQMNEIGEILGEVTSQSGETRHDNAGYDEAMRMMQLLTTRSKEMDAILNNANIVNKSTQKDTVQIGSQVTIQFCGKEMAIVLGGSHTISKRVSYLSPLGQALIGKTRGTQGVVAIGNKQHPRTIISIDI